jgi:Domain of unknown function (DUF932)
MNIMQNYGRYGDAAAHRKFGQSPISLDELRKVAPTIFAEHAHESRSSRYSYLPTYDVVQQLAKEGFDPYTVKVGKSRIPGKEHFTKHLIRFRHRSLTDVKSGDHVLEIGLLNSHDGSSAWEIMGALWGVGCLNALVSAGKMLINLKIPHKGDQMRNVIDGTYTVMNESRRLMDVPREWGARQLTRVEQLQLATEAHKLRFEDASNQMQEAIKPVALLSPRREADAGPDLWRTFNVVQENVIKGGLGGRGRDADGRLRNVTTRHIKNIDQDVRLNRQLWELAEEFA